MPRSNRAQFLAAERMSTSNGLLIASLSITASTSSPNRSALYPDTGALDEPNARRVTA
jgi:hypothetical protein